MTHTLLPRSTGLHYILRSLSPRLPALHVLDATIAYPGTLHSLLLLQRLISLTVTQVFLDLGMVNHTIPYGRYFSTVFLHPLYISIYDYSTSRPLFLLPPYPKRIPMIC